MNSRTSKAGSNLPSWFPQLILGLIAFFLYSNTFQHGYVLDDQIVITDNPYVQEGLDGLDDIFRTDPLTVFLQNKQSMVQGGRYRPLSLATFAIEQEIFEGNPTASHVINAALYALLVVLVFGMMRLLPRMASHPKFYFRPAFLIALLFAVHPIHTEVIANIKGRDELLALLFCIVALRSVLKWQDNQQIWRLLLAFAAFFLALLAKESAIPLILLIPLALYFFRAPTSRQYALLGTGIAVVFCGYLVLRISMVGGFGGELPQELMNNPFVDKSFAERLAIAFHGLWLYVWKMIWPHPLSHDYYPWAFSTNGWADPYAILGLLVHLGMAVYALLRIPKRDPVAFGLIWYLATISIVSNIPFSVGTLLSERFLFIPGLGLIWAAVMALEQLSYKQHRNAKLALLGISGIFAVLTFLRNPAWKDNFTLFVTDVIHVPNSAKANNSAGGALVERGDETPVSQAQRNYYDEASYYLEEAVRIHPSYAQAWLLLGNAHGGLGYTEKALAAYDQAIRYKPNFRDAYINAAVVAFRGKFFTQSADYYRAVTPLNPGDQQIWFNRGLAFEQAGVPDSAIFAYERAIVLDPNDWRAIGNLALIYGRDKQNPTRSIALGRQAIAINPKVEWLYKNTGIALAMINDQAGALDVFQQGIQYFPNSAELHGYAANALTAMGNMEQANTFILRAQQLSEQNK